MLHPLERPGARREHLHQHQPRHRGLIADLAREGIHCARQPALPPVLGYVGQRDATRHAPHRGVIGGQQALLLALREQVVQRSRRNARQRAELTHRRRLIPVSGNRPHHRPVQPCALM